jgi:hypothetical protein
MFGDGALSFREHAMREPLPLAVVQDAVLEFIHGRDDAALFGAQAVNACVDEPRMTQDVGILSPRAGGLAEEICKHLNDRFKVAVWVREVRGGIGFRIYQLQKPRNRHLVDVRPVAELPSTRRVDDVLVVAPDELIANKVLAFQHRKGQPKSFTDRRDVAVLLLRFPELKADAGPVRVRLEAAGAGADALAAWAEIVAEELREPDDAEEFNW